MEAYKQSLMLQPDSNTNGGYEQYTMLIHRRRHDMVISPCTTSRSPCQVSKASLISVSTVTRSSTTQSLSQPIIHLRHVHQRHPSTLHHVDRWPTTSRRHRRCRHHCRLGIHHRHVGWQTSLLLSRSHCHRHAIHLRRVKRQTICCCAAVTITSAPSAAAQLLAAEWIGGHLHCCATVTIIAASTTINAQSVTAAAALGVGAVRWHHRPMTTIINLPL